MQYAYDISNGNDRFVYMLEAESGVRNIRSNYIDSKGNREPSYGYCQIHKDYHPHIVNDQNFSDWKWQIEQCYKLYSNGTIFYGATNKDLMTRARQNIKIN